MKKTQDECSKALTFIKGEKADFFDVSFFRMVIWEINVLFNLQKKKQKTKNKNKKKPLSVGLNFDRGN